MDDTSSERTPSDPDSGQDKLATGSPSKGKIRSDLIIGTIVISVVGGLCSKLLWAIGEMIINNPSPQDGILYGLVKHLSDVNTVVNINLTVTGLSVLFFIVVAYVSRRRHFARTTFAIWAVAWTFAFWGIYTVHYSGERVFLFLDAACSISILVGGLYINDQLRWSTAILLLVPIVSSALSSTGGFYWFPSLVNYAIFLYFAVVLFGHYRERHAWQAHVVFICYSLYASVQLLFPVMTLLGQLPPPQEGFPDVHKLTQVIGYVIGMLSKGGGFLGLLFIGFDPARLD